MIADPACTTPLGYGLQIRDSGRPATPNRTRASSDRMLWRDLDRRNDASNETLALLPNHEHGLEKPRDARAINTPKTGPLGVQGSRRHPGLKFPMPLELFKSVPLGARKYLDRNPRRDQGLKGETQGDIQKELGGLKLMANRAEASSNSMVQAWHPPARRANANTPTGRVIANVLPNIDLGHCSER
ncbi:hypothetical protein P154DRAFT_572156 [Amniculicola lignicola CBS 123094]|uniref:Uncharacterized protein n=1 Tax=Amniculicola lignicola CBS 123094 TaxID=1392246 RepID=A0A6A5WSE8_9PLEO|nr:hypothetical protein P154DRAFT_572156 [Amniculicola lignicola CBS 123094]